MALSHEPSHERHSRSADRRVRTDPVLASYIEDFTAGIEVLKSSAGAHHFWAAQQLCVLSREVIFRLGPPNAAMHDLVNKLVSLFRSAAEEIQVSGGTKEREFRAFKENINARADTLAKNASGTSARSNSTSSGGDVQPG